MANTAQARKRARQAEQRRQRNAGQRTHLRTAIKKVTAAIKSGNKDQATAAYQAAMPLIDSMTNKGIIHQNKAARHKSRLNQHLRAL